jgi:hypothetical protein
MTPAALSLMLALLLGACAGANAFHDGPTGLDHREQRALLAATRGRPDGFARFWLRPRCRFGLVKWSEEKSRAVKAAPSGLLDLVRDEVGRVNRASGDGETVFVSVTVFHWERRWFGRSPLVGVEVVGRDRAGQVIWMGEDRLAVPRQKALNLAEPDELLLAREVGRKLKLELGR